MSDNMGEKMKGMAKEAMGKMSGDDSKEREGEAQQKRGQKGNEAERLEDQAEQKRAEQAGHKGEQMRNEG